MSDAVGDKAADNTDQPSLRTVADALACKAMLSGIAQAAGSFASDLASVHAPPEVARLADNTAAVAYEVRDAASPVSECMSSAETSNSALTSCNSVNSFMNAADELHSDLDAWKPYGVGS